ncbi:MAG: SCP2 sterol-binding domain-containing protein [Solirubrobacteraceae bacterium]|nr:SCP2 sterol-binding domain-containing protein [Solirubrobacteraceae bacterium]
MPALLGPSLDRLAAAWARRASDATIERLLGSRRGQAFLMRALARRFDPGQARGFVGELQIDLRAAGGSASSWTIVAGERAARSRRGPAARPAATVAVATVDLVRVALRQADADRLLLDGRLDLAGDWRVASRIGAMFGRAR